MSTITREQLRERARGKVKSLQFAAKQTAFADSRTELEEELELALIALASLEAEAVGEVIEQQSGMMLDGLVISEKPIYRNIKGIHNMKMMPLGTQFYAAPPAPVAVPDAIHSQGEKSASDDYYALGWNACRAAMLQGAEPATTDYKLPFEQWLSQQNEPIDVDCGCVTTEAFNHWLRVAYEAGNSPVIPDAYDIKAFGIFSATEGENGLMMEVDRFHFETDSCPQVGKDKFVPKFAIQAIINRLQKHCDNMEADALVDVLSTSSAPLQEVKP